MRLSQGRVSARRLPEPGAGRVPPAAPSGDTGRIAARYVSVTGPVLRGPAGVAVAVAWFAVAGAITGPGFLLAAAVGFAATPAPGPVLSWYRTGTEAAVYLVVLAVGYALEWAVAARTGQRVLR